MEHVFAMQWERTAGASSAAPPERVWAVLLDGRHWSSWYEGAEWMTVEGPLEPGSVVTVKLRRLRQTALRIEAVLPERLLALVVTFGPLAALRFRWELAPDAGGTAITQTVATSGPLAGLLLDRAAHRFAAAMPANLERLAVRAVASPEQKKSAVVADRANAENE